MSTHIRLQGYKVKTISYKMLKQALKCANKDRGEYFRGFVNMSDPLHISASNYYIL